MSLGGGGLEGLTNSAIQALIDASVSDALDAHQKFSFSSADLQNPNNSDWSNAGLTALAPAAADSNNAALSVRLFDDTTQEGVGFQLVVPSGMSSMTIGYISRAETAPAGTRQVGIRLCERGIADNGAIIAWDCLALNDVDLPANELFQYQEQTLSPPSLSVTAGELTQFELLRVPAVGTNLPGDWALLQLNIEFN